jgi:6-pyruvoyltetrahydropterin/6-carboxytetrahydropterin synthase
VATPEFRIRLAKEDFKFSAAHFTLFADGSAELLHGHNYRVSVEIVGEELDRVGLLVDFVAVKRAIRAACAALDERTLVPDMAPGLAIRENVDGAGTVEIGFGDRRYRFPRTDLVLLPLENSSIELLSRWLWREIAPALISTSAKRMTVWVEETAGQSCAYAAELPFLIAG